MPDQKGGRCVRVTHDCIYSENSDENERPFQLACAYPRRYCVDNDDCGSDELLRGRYGDAVRELLSGTLERNGSGAVKPIGQVRCQNESTCYMAGPDLCSSDVARIWDEQLQRHASASFFGLSTARLYFERAAAQR